MEEDDEFGDLYTDVLRPLEASVQSQIGGAAAPSRLPGRPIDLNVNSDDEEILYGASDSKTSFPNSNSNSAIPLKLSAPIQEKTLPESGSRPEGLGLDLNLGGSRVLRDGGSGFGGKGLEKADGMGMVDFMEEDDLNIVVEERDNKDDDMVEKDADFKDKTEQNQKEGAANLLGQGLVGGFGTGQMIPGLSERLENPGGSNFDDEWDSDESEDDLQIVLNEGHGPIGMERMPGVGDDEDDEDGEPLVIVADNGDASHHPHHQQQMILDEQEWASEEGGPGTGEAEKEVGDAAKAGGGGGTTTPAAVPPRIGYSNHMYHHPYHSQFKVSTSMRTSL